MLIVPKNKNGVAIKAYIFKSLKKNIQKDKNGFNYISINMNKKEIQIRFIENNLIPVNNIIEIRVVIQKPLYTEEFAEKHGCRINPIMPNILFSKIYYIGDDSILILDVDNDKNNIEAYTIDDFVNTYDVVYCSNEEELNNLNSLSILQ